MAIIIDKRKNAKGQSAPNRQRFIERYKHKLKKSVEEIIEGQDIKDAMKKREVRIKEKDLSEPMFNHNPRTGKENRVLSGNKTFSRGDTIENDKRGAGAGTSGSDSGSGEDEFVFTLSKDEFFDIYFSELHLPNYIKEGIKKSLSYKRKKAGYSKEGIPTRLSLKKTFENALARRISTKAQGKKPRYLDDIDVRYDYYTAVPRPAKFAVMFCMMDISASMGEFEKQLAKKFFILLYLFLNKEYNHVELHFISHTTEAQEVTEDEFFYSQETGGTVVSSGFEVIKKIVKEKYDSSTTNLYIAQASDGDNFSYDLEDCVRILEEDLLPTVQYFAYIQTENEERAARKRAYESYDLYTCYEPLAERFPNLNLVRINEARDVYSALCRLFSARGKKQ